MNNFNYIENGQLVKKGSVIGLSHKRRGSLTLIALEDFYYGEEDFLPVAYASRSLDFGVVKWNQNGYVACRRELCYDAILMEEAPGGDSS